MPKKWLLKLKDKGSFFLGNLGGEEGIDAWTPDEDKAIVFSNSEKKAAILTIWGRNNSEWVEKRKDA